jgi:hypothetical protein
MRDKIKYVLRESKFSTTLNHAYVIGMLRKMYGYSDVDMVVLKSFESSPYYTPTNNSFDYMEQYNDYIMGKKMGIKEATDSSSTGSYETPGFLAKNIPNMKQAAKTTYGGPGGKFVKIKAKCRKYPYCNQGAIDDPIEYSTRYKGESGLNGDITLTPTYPKGYKGNIHLPKTKWVNEDLDFTNKYDSVRDSLYTIFYVAKTLGRFGYNLPSIIRDYKKHKNDKDALLLVVAKYKADLHDYMDMLFKKHPNFKLKRMLSKLSDELQKLENTTLDNFEKNPDRFSKHQQDILL